MSQDVIGKDFPVKELLQVESVKVVVSLGRQGGECLARQGSS